MAAVSKSRTVRFLHTADWHLGRPFMGISDPLKRSRVQQERFNSVRRMKRAIDEFLPEFVVVCGDLFDSPTATNATVTAGLDAIASLEIPVYVIPGNHDYGGGGSIWEHRFFQSESRRLARNLHVLRVREPVEQEHAILLPCPMQRRHETEDPTAWLRSIDYSKLPDKPRIVLAHGSVETFGNSETPDVRTAGQIQPNVIHLDQLPNAELDYIALGDWHGGFQVSENAFYSGTPEPDRFPKTGQSPGRAILATVGRTKKKPSVEWIDLGLLRWHTGEISVGTDGAASVDRWLTAATEHQGFDRALVRVVLRGCVTLEGRLELERVKESWAARLLRFDVDDQLSLAPSAAEAQDLAERPGDPILASVAAELIESLGQSKESTAERLVIEEALAFLHASANDTQ